MMYIGINDQNPNSDWFWLMLIDADWYWLVQIDADWCWLMLIVADWFWSVVKIVFIAIGNEYFVFMDSDWENCDFRANRDTGRVQSGLS